MTKDLIDLNSKAYSTILSFAFTSLEDRAWEFTHKSFGEALASEAIGRVLEDISEIGKYGERWRLPLPQAACNWIETFGPYFLTSDILEFCRGWLKNHNEHFLSNLLARMIEIYSALIGPSVNPSLTFVSQSSERSVINILGNSIRSWFAIINQTMEWLERINEESAKSYFHSLSAEEFRMGVYLSNYVSQLSSGESRPLFKNASKLFVQKQKKHSDYYINNLFRVYYYYNYKKLPGASRTYRLTNNIMEIF